MKYVINRTISLASRLVRRYNVLFAGSIIVLMGALSFGSMIGNSAIVDEVAHIPAGYSYLHYGDYRLNPEHPPLIKDLAALPLQFMNLKFPDTLPAWTSDVNGQWETGWNFLYHIGNDADAILFWSRLPILLLALGFGLGLYFIVRKHWGIGAGLLAVFFYGLSPNILGHSALVTTDLAASVFMFLAIAAFMRYVTRPVRANFWLLALALALAELAKFSALLLYPFLGLVSLGLVWLLKNPSTKQARIKTYVGGLIGASIASLAGIWTYYGTQVYHMPVSVQNKLIIGSFAYYKTQFLGDFLVSINHWPIMHPIVQYLTGVGMVYGRVTGGNVTYFNGHVQSGSFKGYFPELFLVKTQLGLLLLIIGLLIYVIWRARNTPAVNWLARLAENIRTNVYEWVLGAFVVFYFVIAVAGNLDLGIRHILPIYIPIFVLTAVATVRVLRRLPAGRIQTYGVATAAGLILWYGLSTVLNFPNYISYFNEAIGGPGQSHKYFTDSSLDWGQDLKRFKIYVDQHPEINKIAIDYFGGGVPAYYFCLREYDSAAQLVAAADGYDCTNSRIVEWHAQYGAYTGQYIAVSETYLENDPYYANLYHQPGYDYLRSREPMAKIGNSIFIFKLY
ncbi:MAG: phospholipid carrier-dependent glycosyltransferase [Candidatus Saccharimonadales bacterium]